MTAPCLPTRCRPSRRRRRHTTVASGLSVLVALAGCSGSPRVDGKRTFEEYDRLAAQRLWPGFRPQAIPLALYDGERTYLLRHPDPPKEFRPVRGNRELWAMVGRYPTVNANSAVDVAGVSTAALLAESADRSPERLARLLVHEAFHVFQKERHPEWAANEVDLFTYPVEDVELLRLRRLETAAMRRALQPADSARELCWSRTVVRLRDERLRRLPEDAVEYERRTELWEGLARYVERRAAGQTGPPGFPAEGFSPDAVRERAYSTGHALAYLLDRLQPAWAEELKADSVPSLAGRLRVALATTEGPRCRLTPDESGRARDVARTDVAALRRERVRRKEAFEAHLGWSLTVVALAGQPMFPAEFDPLNVQILGEGEVLHTRLLRLQNDGAVLDVLNGDVLTEAAGPHPLFTGVRRVRLTGLEKEPRVELTGDTLRIEAPGFRGEFRGASLRKEGQRWTVELAGAPDVTNR